VARPKFRVRTALIFVAVLALVMAVENMRRKRAFCLRRAEDHRHILITADGICHLHILLLPEVEQSLAKVDPHSAWHLGLVAAYRRVASHPWEAQPDEPPEPEHFFTNTKHVSIMPGKRGTD
jgi:hypothetical protein